MAKSVSGDRPGDDSNDSPVYLEVPPERLSAEALEALLQEYASRDGTDYGEREHTLAEKVAQLRGQLQRGELRLLYESTAAQWDLLPADVATQLLSCADD